MKPSFGRTALKFLARCGEKEKARLVEAIGELPDKGAVTSTNRLILTIRLVRSRESRSD